MPNPANTRRDHLDADVLTVNEPWTPRVSWGAIFGGALLAVAIQFMLALLGLGIGLTTVDPATEEGAGMGGLRVGAAVWSVLTILIAMAAGGWTAGRLAGVPRKTTASLHGLIVWSLATLMLVYVASTVVGALVGGAMSTLGTVARAAGRGVSAAAPSVSGQDVNVDWSSIRQEAMDVLRLTGDPRLQPEALRSEGQEAVQGARQDAAEADLGAALDRLFNRASAVASEVDKSDVANVLAARTGMSRQEAMRRVEQWEGKYQSLRASARGKAGDIRRRAATTTENVTDAAGKSAIWTFAGLLIAAIAAAGAGAAGAPKLIEVRHEEVPVPTGPPGV